MRHIIYIRDELVLEAHPDRRYILLRREGEPGAVRVYLNGVRYLADPMCDIVAQIAGHVARDGRGPPRSRLVERTKASKRPQSCRIPYGTTIDQSPAMGSGL